MLISHLFFLNWFLLLLRRRDFIPDWWLKRRNLLRRRRWGRVSDLFFLMALLWFRLFLIVIVYRVCVWSVFLFFFPLLLILNRLFNLSMLYNLWYHLWLNLWWFLFGRLLLLLFHFRHHLCRGFLLVSIFMTRLILLCSLFLFWGRILCLVLLLCIRYTHLLWCLWRWYHFIIFLRWHLIAPILLLVFLLWWGCSVILQMLVFLSK